MLCNHCGRPVKRNSRFCASCGAAVMKEGPRQQEPVAWMGTEHMNRPEDITMQGKDKLRHKGLIVGLVAAGLIVILIVAGVLLLKGGRAPDSVGATGTSEGITEQRDAEKLTATLSGAGYEFQYDPDLWKEEKVDGYDVLTFLTDGGWFMIGGANKIPAIMMIGADFSKESSAKNMYGILKLAVPQYVPEGYSLSGGTETFLALKEGVYYAAMDYSNNAGDSGKFYLLVSQKDKANLIILTRNVSKDGAAEMEENIMHSLKSLTLSK